MVIFSHRICTTNTQDHLVNWTCYISTQLRTLVFSFHSIYFMCYWKLLSVLKCYYLFKIMLMNFSRCMKVFIAGSCESVCIQSNNIVYTSCLPLHLYWYVFLIIFGGLGSCIFLEQGLGSITWKREYSERSRSTVGCHRRRTTVDSLLPTLE
jgi:hypothetical protein